MRRNIHVHHTYEDKSNSRFWAWVTFGIPLIIIFIFVYLILAFFIPNRYNFIIALIVAIYPTLLVSKKLNKIFDKFSDWLNNR